MKESVLIVDDDVQIVNMLKRALTYEGYHVLSAANGEEALPLIRQGVPDLVILDIMMPRMNGWDLCMEIRKLDEKLPVLMLTAKDEVENRVKGLDLGADDYVIKPFALDELLARVRAHIRRYRLETGNKAILFYSDLVLNLETRKCWRGEREIPLKGKEFDLLTYFMQNPGHVLAKDQILEKVWGLDYEGESNVIEVYIASLRQKMEEQGEHRLIHTIRGAGYVLREE
jgi:two-component system response regulator MprA